MTDSPAGPFVICPGCKAPVPQSDGPTHAYYGEAPGCWAVYGEVLAREYSDVRFAKVHRVTVDSYAAQHPGRRERRTIQSVAVHLIGLYLVFECDLAMMLAAPRLQAAAARAERFEWLEPPPSLGEITVVDVHAAGDDMPERHTDIVLAWGRSTWAAWHEHHASIRRWANS